MTTELNVRTESKMSEPLTPMTSEYFEKVRHQLTDINLADRIALALREREQLREWKTYALKAMQEYYATEWRGDSVVLREARATVAQLLKGGQG